MKKSTRRTVLLVLAVIVSFAVFTLIFRNWDILKHWILG